MKRAAATAIAVLCATAAPAGAQTADSVLVEVSLIGVGSTLIVAAHDTATGVLSVPAAPIYALAELGDPPLPVMTVEELRKLLQVEISWLPRRLELVLRDPWQVLPATRARVDRLRADNAMRASAPAEQRRPGLFGGLTMDDRREAMVDLGYSLGKVFGRGGYSTVSGASWSAGANPLPAVWLTYAQSERFGPRLSARLALKRTWIAAEYLDDEVHLSGASAVGPVVVFASSRDRFAVTWRGSVDVQVGHSGDRSAVRVGFGPLDPSPVSVPAVF